MTRRPPIRLVLAAILLASLVACASSGAESTNGGTSPAMATTSPAQSTPAPRDIGSPTPEPRPLLAHRVIVIDPGHNGRNGDHVDQINELVEAGGFTKPCNTVGAQSESGYLEATFNWEVAKKLQDILEAEAATVVLTRSSNAGWGPCIDERGRAAAEAHADLLISVHADGNVSPSARGFHVIAPGRVPGYTDNTVGPSAEVAAAVRDALRAAGFTPSTYEGRAGLVTRTDIGTLNMAGVPAVMVECGNLRNEADANVLESATGRQRIARALANGILSYLS